MNNQLKVTLISLLGLVTVLGAGLVLTFPLQAREPDPALDADLRDNARQRGETRRKAAMELFRQGQREAALDLLNQATLNPETPFDRFDSHRMRGTYLSILGRGQEAMDEFRLALELSEDDPYLQKSPSFGSVALQYVQLLRVNGRLDEAIGVNRRIIEIGPIEADVKMHQNALLNFVNLHTKNNDNAAAIAAIDELFERFPRYGESDGTALYLKLQAADLKDPSRSTAEYVQVMEQLWAEQPAGVEAIEIGLLLSQAYIARRQFDQAISVDQTVVDIVDGFLRATQRPRTTDPEYLDDALRTSLIQLAAVRVHGRADVAIPALLRLCDMTDDANVRQAYISELADLAAGVQR